MSQPLLFCLPNMENKFHFIFAKGYFRITNNSKKKTWCFWHYLGCTTFRAFSSCRWRTVTNLKLKIAAQWLEKYRNNSRSLPWSLWPWPGLRSVIVGEELSKASSCCETPWAWTALAAERAADFSWKLFCFTWIIAP